MPANRNSLFTQRKRRAADRQKELMSAADGSAKNVSNLTKSKQIASNILSSRDKSVQKNFKRYRTENNTHSNDRPVDAQDTRSDGSDTVTVETELQLRRGCDNPGNDELASRQASPVTPARVSPAARITEPRSPVQSIDKSPVTPSIGNASCQVSPSNPHTRNNCPGRSSINERRRARRTSNTPNDHDLLIGQSHGEATSAVGTPLQYNRIKAQLTEAISEKRSIRAALDLANDKCQDQDKEIRRLSQQVHALENMISKPTRGGRRSSRKGTWNKDDENSVIAPYKGVRLQMDIIVNAEAALVVTESTFYTGGRTRVHDWTGSSTLMVSDVSRPLELSVTRQDGTIAIANCAMRRCFSKKFYTDRFESTSSFVRYVTKKILDESMCFGMDDNEKDVCLAKMSSYGPVLSKCRTALREETNNCKQGARNIFLKSLCYRRAHLGEEKRNKNENDQRIKEKKLVHERCVKKTSENRVDTTYWRTTPYASLYNTDTDDTEMVDRMLAAEEDGVSKGIIDNLFMNEAARLAFNRLKGYAISKEASDDERDASIIWLARADAWITTAMMNIQGKGKGGTHSNEFVQKYETLLPEALELIISDVWEDIFELSQQELDVCIPDSEPDDVYGNKIRTWTMVVQSPEDGYLYLYVTPEYVKRSLCSWIGNIKDLQIGRCKSSDQSFARITRKTIFDELEESDIDEKEVVNGNSSSLRSTEVTVSDRVNEEVDGEGNGLPELE